VRIGFGPFVLDLDARQLLRGDCAVHLTPKAFDLLAVLVLERPRAVSKQLLQERLWPGAFVVEANLSNLVAEIRRALDDRGRSPKWVRTAHGFGYAFSREAVTLAGAASGGSGRPVCWLSWGRQRFPLSVGEHVIGRDAHVEVRLDAATVSRRHARVVVTADGAMIEDAGSKNGTWRGGDRIAHPVRLADGDAIRLGSLLLTFHMHARSVSTQTQSP